PGFGFSERPDSLSGIDDMILHYADLLGALQVVRPVLVGHSLGGWIAASFATFYAVRIGALVLANAGGLHVEEAPIPDLFALTGERLTAAVFHRPVDALRLFPIAVTEEDRIRRFRDMTTLA